MAIDRFSFCNVERIPQLTPGEFEELEKYLQERGISPEDVCRIEFTKRHYSQNLHGLTILTRENSAHLCIFTEKINDKLLIA